MEILVWLKGEVMPAESARISVLDRGFLFGDGVYETGRVYDRCPLFLEEHWKRLRKSANQLEINLSYTDKELTEGLFQLGRAFNKNSFSFRTVITRGIPPSISLDSIDPKTPCTLLHFAQAIPSKLEKLHKEGLHVLTSEVKRNPSEAQNPDIKTSSYLNSLLAFQDVRRRGGEDAIFCNIDGYVAEGTTFSVFGVKNSKLLTPSLETGILESITRRHVLGLAQKHYPVEEGFFDLKTFLSCEEVFLASSVREIVPIREWDGKVFPVQGSVTTHLHELLREDIQQYISSHPKF